MQETTRYPLLYRTALKLKIPMNHSGLTPFDARNSFQTILTLSSDGGQFYHITKEYLLFLRH